MDITLRSATDDDWPAMSSLGAVGFAKSMDPDVLAAFRSLAAADGAVVACDGDDVVGMAQYLDLRLTVPGGAVLPTAGVWFVVVAPTHRRRGLLRAMYTELHRRIADSGYPIAALTASEGGIYGRFGYGPATIEYELTIDRRFAVFHPDAPDPGGVRLVTPRDQHAEFAAIYERWRRRTPGAQLRPEALWDQLLGDRENSRSKRFAFLHPDGYVVYRVRGTDPKVVRVSEFTAATGAAHAALWRALLGLDLVEQVVIGTHPGDPLPHLLTDSRLARTTGRRDALWLRIMDIPAALQARTYHAELSTVLQVLDGFRSDGGRFALDISDGHARCTPTDAPAQAELDLDVLGSLYLGAHPASTLAAANRLRAADAKLVRRLDAAFASDVPAEIGFRF